MKQKLFLAALSTFALAACTQVDDLPVVQNNAIGFENVVNKNSRAITGDLNSNNFDLFSVYGYYINEDPGIQNPIPVQIFNGEIVTKVGGGDTGQPVAWTYDNTRYWNPGYTYYFYAYSCADIAMTEVGADDTPYAGQEYPFGKPVMALNLAETTDRALDMQNYLCNSDHQHDLIVAKNEGMKGMEKTADVTIKRSVAFKFEHALSKINVVFSSKFPEEYDIYISDAKIVGFYDRATFDFGEMAWINRSISDGGTSIDLEITKGNDVTSQGVRDGKVPSVTTGSVFLLPMKYDEDDNNNRSALVDLQFTIDVQLNGNSFLKRSLKAQWQPNWQKGTAYTYYVDLGGKEAQLEPIVFESTQDMADPGSWGDSQRVDMQFSLQ